MTKVRADRTVIVIGVFLFILGLAVAWNGYGYVHDERGWTLVISGTVVFSTGLLLVALGLVLRELRAVAGSAARATLLLAKAKTLHLKDFDEDTLAPPRAFVPEERAVAAEFAPVENEFELPVAKETDWKAGRASRLHLPRVDEIAAEAGASRNPNPLAWMIRPEKPEPVSPPPPPPPEDKEFESWLEPEQDFGQEAQPEPLQTRQVAELPAEPPEAEDLTGSLDAPEPALQMEEPEPASQPEAELESELEPESEPELELEPELQPEPASTTEAGPPPKDAASGEESAQPEIIGRYEAHGAHYVMYADGSIDADTAHGVYRFASMEELKQFIARQA